MESHPTNSTFPILLQSKFFSPSFNSAIFDGPIRIYFSQLHEAQALKIYLFLQKNLSNQIDLIKPIYQQTGQIIAILLYPSKEAFHLSFDDNGSFISTSTLNGNSLIGICAPVENEQLSEVINVISLSISSWGPKPSLEIQTF